MPTPGRPYLFYGYTETVRLILLIPLRQWVIIPTPLFFTARHFFANNHSVFLLRNHFHVLNSGTHFNINAHEPRDW
jgi:hypothetical protein